MVVGGEWCVSRAVRGLVLGKRFRPVAVEKGVGDEINTGNAVTACVACIVCSDCVVSDGPADGN